MPTARRVTCVDKDSDRHEGITHLGGSGWRETRAEVVRQIEDGDYEYYTFEGGKRAEVKVRSRDGAKYVQTQADGLWTDNLLALPRCPK
ncbi:MAG TPA: DUF3892 domain-containing protein [Thermoanaerobaculia bacterium]|jgi:hypothetical protein|nr:DUF3892 domain-containing protein [Thermoanaerobaculia bacterium]